MGTIVEKKDEHILVCLSSSPTNKKIISTAAKMAGVFHARFICTDRGRNHISR